MGHASSRGQEGPGTPPKARRGRFRRCVPTAVVNAARATKAALASAQFPHPPLAAPSSTYLAAASYVQTPHKRDRSRSEWTESTATGGCSRRESRDRTDSDDIEEQLRRRTRVRLFVKPRGEQVSAVSVYRDDEVQCLTELLGLSDAVLVFGTQLLEEGTQWRDYAITTGSVIEIWPNPLRRTSQASTGSAVPRVPLAHLVRKEDRSWYDREASVSSSASDSSLDSDRSTDSAESCWPASLPGASVLAAESSYAASSLPASTADFATSAGGSVP